MSESRVIENRRLGRKGQKSINLNALKDYRQIKYEVLHEECIVTSHCAKRGNGYVGEIRFSGQVSINGKLYTFDDYTEIKFKAQPTV